jgi:hypothetical protein
MLHRLAITTGDDYTPLGDAAAARLVECRVEMELSKAARFALRFEEDICEQKNELLDGDDPLLKRDTRVGIFTSFAENSDTTECLLVGRVTKVRSSHIVGGRGSWVEVHGEDRRVDMGKVHINGTYSGLASQAVEQIVGQYGYKKTRIDPTLIEYKKPQPQLTQSDTDLAFIESIARANNMDFWIEYKVKAGLDKSVSDVTETAILATSPPADKSVAGSLPPVLSDPKHILRLNAAGDACANLTKLDCKIDYDKPTSAFGFAMDDAKEREVRSQLAEDPVVADPAKLTETRKMFEARKDPAPPKPDPVAAQLAKESLVQEQSWFVEADCSASSERLGFLVLPHAIVKVENMGPNLSGLYQVKTATHVFTPTDRLVDFTLRANGFEESADG